MRSSVVSIAVGIVAMASTGLALEPQEQEPSWKPAMTAVHAKFTGTPGTLALFGDSITVSLAFWAPLRQAPENMPDDLAAAHQRVSRYIQADCWDKWRGADFGNQGSTTIRWAHENVETWLKTHNPEVAVVMFGTNDLFQLRLPEFEQKTSEVVRQCLANGTIVLLTTQPPCSGKLDQSRQFADAVRRVAKKQKVPLIDYHAEVLKRRPKDWDGSSAEFKEFTEVYQVPTLISRDGVHPSNPKLHQDFSDESLSKNGYLLRGYLTLRAYDEVIEQILSPDRQSESP